MMLYALSLPALVEMIDTMLCELHEDGLPLHAAKYKIFITQPLDHPMYAEVSQDVAPVVHGRPSCHSNDQFVFEGGATLERHSDGGTGTAQVPK